MVRSSAWLSFRSKRNVQAADRNIDFRRDQPELFNVGLDIREVTARSGIDRDGYTCSAEQLHMRVHAAASHRSAENDVRMVEVENDGHPDLHAIFFLIDLRPNASAIKRAGIGLQVIEGKLFELRHGNGRRRRDAPDARYRRPSPAGDGALVLEKRLVLREENPDGIRHCADPDHPQ